MTLIYEKLTGYGRACKLIVYVTAFHDVFKGTGGMKFYDGDFSGVVDVILDKSGSLTVCKYPHNNDKFVEEFSTKNQSKIKGFMEKLIVRNSQSTGITRAMFTLKFSEDSTIEEVKRGDFSRYHPTRETRDEMFTFDVPFANGGFPNVFVMEKSCRNGMYASVLDVFSAASHDVYDCATNQTPEGKALVWAIYNSWKRGSFEPVTPDMPQTLHIPTNGRDRIPAFLNQTDLLFWGDKVGSEMPQTVTVVDPFKTKDEEKAEKKEEERKPLTNPFGKVDPENLEAWVEQGIKSTGSVNLTDLYVYSLEKTLRLIQNPNAIIHVVLDSLIGVRKMCIYQGMIHYVPNKTDFDPIQYFGDDVDLFQADTEDTYPRYLLTGSK